MTVIKPEESAISITNGMQIKGFAMVLSWNNFLQVQERVEGIDIAQRQLSLMYL